MKYQFLDFFGCQSRFLSPILPHIQKYQKFFFNFQKIRNNAEISTTDYLEKILSILRHFLQKIFRQYYLALLANFISMLEPVF